MTCETVRPLLSAHVDSELPAADALAVAEHLTTCADCAHEYELLLRTVATLRARLPRHAAPDVLRGRVRTALRESRDRDAEADDFVPNPSLHVVRPSRASSTWPWRSIAAGLLLAILGAGLGSSATLVTTERNRSALGGVQGAVLSSHIRSLMPGHLTDIRSNDQHNVKPWFDGRLDYSPAVPRLDSLGFPLLGGRLDYLAGRAVAAVVYGRRQHLINVFSWPVTGAGDAPVQRESQQGYNLLGWRHGGIEYWVVSDLNVDELSQFTGYLRR